ncbi:hypothetical protein P154DRAFT_263426 [Amniculicola lignicola CBS 123094]|uniref:Uncharacterized protein n=1 Tax=Amniculicola lignicola CBS 123094 TaxID=1392246 RepID=A0A6A5WAJ0_9PLEO|nr:hypothetical protein P154DRAFT_263426 [Amniculicola lignicola CBS 123094]
MPVLCQCYASALPGTKCLCAGQETTNYSRQGAAQRGCAAVVPRSRRCVGVVARLDRRRARRKVGVAVGTERGGTPFKKEKGVSRSFTQPHTGRPRTSCGERRAVGNTHTPARWAPRRLLCSNYAGSVAEGRRPSGSASSATQTTCPSNRGRCLQRQSSLWRE